MLIPVAFEIAYSLLRALRVRRACLRFEELIHEYTSLVYDMQELNALS